MYFLGVDFGSQQDYTALALVRRDEVARASVDAAGRLSLSEASVVYEAVYLERMDLGTPYTQIVRHLKHITMHGELRGDVTVIADATGVGLPVIQMMRQEGIAPLVPIGIHGGQQVNEKGDGYSVPKRDLVTALLIAVQSRRLKIAGDIGYKQELIHELQSFKMKQNKVGESYEALVEKDHDDLVLALSYAIWYPEKVLGSRAWDSSPDKREAIDLLER